MWANPHESRAVLRLDRRRAALVAGSCLLVTAGITWLTVQWLHALEPVLAPERAPLWLALARQPTIVATVAAALFCLLAALVVALLPPLWLFGVGRLETKAVASLVQQVQNLIQTGQQETEPAEAGASAAVPPTADAQTPPAEATAGQPQASESGAPTSPQTTGQPAAQPTGQTTQPPAAGTPPQGQTAQPQTGPQAPAAAQPQQPPAQPGQTPPPAEGQPQGQQAQQPDQAQASTQSAPGSPPPVPQPGQIPTVEAMITEDQAEDALADMGDVSDILSAFEEDAEVDPYLEALSTSLEDVEIRELTRLTRRIRAALQEERARRQGRRVVA
ncbi:hypothetical protein FKZ61_014850 [Litorilinea aerophila]|uniref:Uncharacterized protein n=1 Tax=Litorilinea aerophila TaxID=1204385 RepID=A0A540VDU5_9CHLR|nr:hypothetical protein [Litorilinea aerophila]MCC9077382.1 hypothetical protein [Litorilinea aerophila]